MEGCWQTYGIVTHALRRSAADTVPTHPGDFYGCRVRGCLNMVMWDQCWVEQKFTIIHNNTIYYYYLCFLIYIIIILFFIVLQAFSVIFL